MCFPFRITCAYASKVDKSGVSMMPQIGFKSPDAVMERAHRTRLKSRQRESSLRFQVHESEEVPSDKFLPFREPLKYGGFLLASFKTNRKGSQSNIRTTNVHLKKVPKFLPLTWNPKRGDLEPV